MKKFNAQKCLQRLGIEEGGPVQQKIDETVLDVCEPYIPMDLSNGSSSEGLIHSGRTHTVIGSGEVIWETPYAHYVHEGIVYVDPETHAAGFLTEDGWKSRRKVSKIPSDRKLQYQGAPRRGSRWVDRSMQEGGIETVEDAARKAVKK